MDLQGQLSNPPYNFGRASKSLWRMLARQGVGEAKLASRQSQRRLKPTQVDELVAMYASGSSVVVVAECFGINRETAMLHLDRRGVGRRVNVRKLDDETVRAAAERYRAGDRMDALCRDFGVNSTTLRSELAKAGVALRKPGRPPSVR